MTIDHNGHDLDCVPPSAWVHRIGEISTQNTQTISFADSEVKATNWLGFYKLFNLL
jgi:hypothetical protein